MRSTAVLLLLASCAGETAPTVQPEALDQLDQLAGCGTADSAWPQYQDILRRLRPPAEGIAFACRIVPGHERWQLLADWLQANRELLPLLEGASCKLHYGMSHHPAPGDPSPVARLALHQNRTLANLLCAAAREAEAADDLTRATALVHAAIRLGQQIARRPLLVDRTIGVSLTGIAGRELRRLLYAQAGRWTRADLQALSDQSLVTHTVRPAEQTQRAEQLIGGTTDAAAMQRVEDTALSEMEQVRAVLALASFRHLYDRFPDRLEHLGPAVAAIPHLRYLPPRGARGPLLYLVIEDDIDPFAVQGPANLEDPRLEKVWAVAPPR